MLAKGAPGHETKAIIFSWLSLPQKEFSSDGTGLKVLNGSGLLLRWDFHALKLEWNKTIEMMMNE